jgi:hypothetical protein
MNIDPNLLRSVISTAVPLVQKFAGSDPRVKQVGDILTALAGEHPTLAPEKRSMDAALTAAVAARRAAMAGARDALRKP